MSPEPPSLERLPGAELIAGGLVDLAAGRESIGALLIEVARSRIAACGVEIPPIPRNSTDAEIRLYFLLGREFGSEAYARYNSHLRLLSSFCRALEHRVSAMRHEGAAL